MKNRAKDMQRERERETGQGTVHKPTGLHELPQVAQKVLARLLTAALRRAQRRRKVLARPGLSAPLPHRLLSVQAAAEHRHRDAVTRNTQQERDGVFHFSFHSFLAFTEFPSFFFSFSCEVQVLLLFFFSFPCFFPFSDGLFLLARKKSFTNTPLPCTRNHDRALGPIDQAMKHTKNGPLILFAEKTLQQTNHNTR